MKSLRASRRPGPRPSSWWTVLRTRSKCSSCSPPAIPRSNNRPPRDKAALRRALQDCQVTDSSTRLTEALKLAGTLIRDKHDPEIHLFSDGAAGDLSEFENKGSARDLSPRGAAVRTTSASPRWISGRTRKTTSERAIYTSVANFSTNARQTVLELLFDNELVDTRPLTVAAGGNFAAGFHRHAGARRHFHRAH